MNAFELRQVDVKQGENTLIHIPTLNIPSQQFSTIIGPNGAGKSTLLRTLAGWQKHTGAIQRHHVEAKQNIAWVGQHEQMDLPLNVREYIALGRLQHQSAWFGGHAENAKQKQIIDLAITQMELERLANRKIHSLSGGEKQRAAIARAICQETPIILLDEPTNHLDLKQQQKLMINLKKLCQSQNKTIVAVIHDLNLACHYADHVILMKDGEVSAAGEVEMLMQHKQLLSEVFDWHIDPIKIGDGHYLFNTRALETQFA